MFIWVWVYIDLPLFTYCTRFFHLGMGIERPAQGMGIDRPALVYFLDTNLDMDIGRHPLVYLPETNFSLNIGTYRQTYPGYGYRQTCPRLHFERDFFISNCASRQSRSLDCIRSFHSTNIQVDLGYASYEINLNFVP